MVVKKRGKHKNGASGIRQISSGDAPLRFSFKFFDCNDSEACPPTFPDGYTQTLMDRLKSVSTWTVNDFVSPKGKSIRNHPVDWRATARPDGFTHLPEQTRDYPAWQFSISANAYGRVMGLLIDDTFHIVWLDMNHNVYP